MANEQENKGATRADTLAEQGAQPVQGKERPVGADIVGAAGGTDASAGARMSGNSGAGGAGLRQTDASGAPGSPGGSMGAAGGTPGAGAVGGTGLGQADTADDTRTGTGSSTGQGTSVAAGGDPSGGNTLAGKPGQGKQP